MIAELQSALHDPSLSKAEYIRVQAVFLRKRNEKRRRIAELTGKSLSVIEDWITAYHQYGLLGLRTKKRRDNPRQKITPAQRTHLCDLLKQKPKDSGFTHEPYWYMSLVKQLVKRETGVIFQSTNSYRKLLMQAGQSCQKVEQIDHHQKHTAHDDFQKQFEAKVKGGRISMWW